MCRISWKGVPVNTYRHSTRYTGRNVAYYTYTHNDSYAYT